LCGWGQEEYQLGNPQYLVRFNSSTTRRKGKGDCSKKDHHQLSNQTENFKENKMNQDFQIPKKTFLLIPAGTYRATITGLEKAVGVYGEQVKITFHVLTDDVEYTDGSVDLLA
jgi:hypothetical protein